MSRTRLWLLLVLWTCAWMPRPAVAQAQEQKEEHASEHGANAVWKWANTLIFAAAMAVLIRRTAPKFFNARSASIQKAIQDATGLKIEADFRYSEIDRKMATLPEEVRKLREATSAEMEREHGRIREATGKQIAVVNQSAEAEIKALRDDGAREIREHAATLALGRSEERLREGLSAADRVGLVRNFVTLVGKESASR